MNKIGNYKILNKIGRGGFANIFQAEHLLLREKACIKQNINQSKEDVEILKYEAKLLWKLDDHHSIPGIKDFFEINENSAAMVTSYIDGNTLEEIVKEDGPIHPEDSCWIMERLLGALYYSHCNGVIHGDLKPQNVFVEPNKRDIKLIDFGTSVYQPNENTKPAGYTPKYAAPELIENQPPLPETDIYGAGIVFLRALGGDMIKKTFRKDTPKQITEFCKKFLNYDPLKRPSWERKNPIEELSDIRQEVFGRRHISLNQTYNVKGGANKLLKKV